jgi:hypothetical protein
LKIHLNIIFASPLPHPSYIPCPISFFSILSTAQ